MILALNLVSCRALSLPGSAVVCLQLVASADSKIYGFFRELLAIADIFLINRGNHWHVFWLHMFWCASVAWANLRIESFLRLFLGRVLAVWTRCGHNNRSRKDRHCNRIPLPLRRRYISHCNPLLAQECQRNTIVARNAREHPILAKYLRKANPQMTIFSNIQSYLPVALTNFPWGVSFLDE